MSGFCGRQVQVGTPRIMSSDAWGGVLIQTATRNERTRSRGWTTDGSLVKRWPYVFASKATFKMAALRRPMASEGSLYIMMRQTREMDRAEAIHFPFKPVESKTRTSHRLDLGSPDDHTTFLPDLQIVEDNRPERPCGSTIVLKH